MRLAARAPPPPSLGFEDLVQLWPIGVGYGAIGTYTNYGSMNRQGASDDVPLPDMLAAIYKSFAKSGTKNMIFTETDQSVSQIKPEGSRHLSR